MIRIKSPLIIMFASLLFLISNSSSIAQTKAIQTTGDVFLYTLPITTLASTFIIKDTKGSWQFTKALIVTEVATFGLKQTIDKERPDMSNNNSFPSGHTSTVFQSAAFIHKRYGFKYSIPAYVFAGFTGFSRINAKKHDGWDVLAGAIIGIGSSYFFTTEYQKEHIELTFNSNDNHYLIGFSYKF